MIRAFNLIGRRPTLPHTHACSTIGAERLNCRVRDGNGWSPLAITTQSRYEIDSSGRGVGVSKNLWRYFELNIDGQHDCKLLLAEAFVLLVYVTGICVYSKFYGQAERAISNGKLNILLHLHIRPINVVVYHGPY